MANQPINLGTAPLGEDGDTVRAAFEKVNSNTSELYSTKADSSSLGSAAFTGSSDYATAAQGVDAREWTAATVTQAEAEAGTATTRRAWTAQRVRQAIVAWWNSATSAFGRGLVAAADAAAGRTALGLGTAATRTALGTTGSIYSRDSILGIVSQSAGIPTGAIIERGSNANGEYVRFADGTLICHHTAAPSLLNPSNIGFEWSPPSAFIALPSVSFSVSNAEVMVSKITQPMAYVASSSATYCSLLNTSGSFVAGDVPILFYMVAIGRWY